MKIFLFDSLSKEKKEFVPLDKNNVRVYACGPTVYNFAHLGNARMSVVTDLLVRVLKQKFKKVTFVSNITDIDDKIIDEAKKKNITTSELTKKFHKIYNEDMKSLGVSEPSAQPKATDHINEMIEIINILIKKKCAYESNKNILFDVKSYKHYGSLSRRVDDDQISGTRIEKANYKKNVNDFILWKPSKNNEPGWDSPWGKGRPGWHIECSAMSQKCLGLPFDIHCGGVDLTFPHHENEIAQSCSMIRQNAEPSNFCKYWFHNGFVTYKNVKMSKSLGNIKLIRDLLKNYEGRLLRLCLLSAHYRQPLDFSESSLGQFRKYLSKLDNFFLNNQTNVQSTENNIYFREFLNCLFDDINTPKAFSILNNQISEFRNSDKKKKELIINSVRSALKILGLDKKRKTQNKFDSIEIEKLIKDRDEARKNKDFQKADFIRDELKKMMVEIEDTQNGTKWFKVN